MYNFKPFNITYVALEQYSSINHMHACHDTFTRLLYVIAQSFDFRSNLSRLPSIDSRKQCLLGLQ